MEVFIRAADGQDRDILGALKPRSSLAWGDHMVLMGWTPPLNGDKRLHPGTSMTSRGGHPIQNPSWREQAATAHPTMSARPSKWRAVKRSR